MAVVTSLTVEKIEELLAGWNGVAASQEQLNALVSQLTTELASNDAELEELNSVTMPQLREDLAAGAVRVAELNDNLLPQLQADLDQHALSLENLNTVDIPSLNERVNSNSDWILELNDTTLPAMQATLDANTVSLSELNDTTLPSLQLQLEGNSGAIADLNNVTLPGLNDRLAAVEAGGGGQAFDPTELQNAIDALELKFPIAEADISDGAITTPKILAGSIESQHVTTVGLDAGVIKFGSMSGDRILANTISSSHIVTTGLDAGVITFGKLSGSLIKALSINSGQIVAAGLDAGIVKFGSMSGDRILANTINSNHVVTTGLDAAVIKFGSMSGDRILANTINSAHVVTAGLDASVIKVGTMSGDRILANTINSVHMVTTGLDAAIIKFGTMSGDRILANTINSGHIIAQGLDAAVIKFGEMSGDRITVNTLHGSKIIGKTITADHLTADVILAKSRIAAVGAQGQSVELNPAGFYVYGPTSEGRPAYVSFPTDSSTAKPNIISGTLQATTLSVEGNATSGQAATFRRNSQLEPGATLTLNNAVVPPVAAPFASSIANETVITSSIIGELAGTAYHPTEDALYILATDQSINNGYQVFTNRIYKLALATNVITYVTSVKYGARTEIPPMGFTYFNNMFHIGYRDGVNILVGQYDPAQSWLQIAGVNFGPCQGAVNFWSSFTLGTDGTNLWIADLGSTTTNGMRFRKYLNTLSTTVQETINTTYVMRAGSARARHMSLNVGAFDFGARKFVVTFDESWDVGNNTFTASDVAVFGTSGGARDASSEFNPMRSATSFCLIWRAATPDTASGKFVGVSGVDDGSTQVIRFNYSELKLSGRTATWSAANTFYRSSDGMQTTISPVTDFVMTSRYDWKATVSTPPAGLGTRVYVAQAASGTGLKLQATLASTVTSANGSTYDAAGVAPPSSNGFGASSTPSVIRSQETTTPNFTAISSTSGSTTLTGVNKFRPWMVGQEVTGSGIPAGTTIVSVATDRDSAVMSAAATATSAALIISFPNQPKLMIRGDGSARIYEVDELIIGGTDDVNFAAGNTPPLRIGDIGGVHMRIDGNEIAAMDADATVGVLNLNLNGWVRLSGHTVKTGTKTVPTSTANTAASVAVTFPTPFPASAPIPTVMLTPNATVPNSSVSVRAISRTGFTIYAVRPTAGTIDVDWLAFAA